MKKLLLIVGLLALPLTVFAQGVFWTALTTNNAFFQTNWAKSIALPLAGGTMTGGITNAGLTATANDVLLTARNHSLIMQTIDGTKYLQLDQSGGFTFPQGINSSGSSLFSDITASGTILGNLFAGNGAGLSNVVKFNPNQFGGASGGTNIIAGAPLTNVNFYSDLGARRVQITNSQATNMVMNIVLGTGAGAGGFTINVGTVLGQNDYGAIFFNPQHDSGSAPGVNNFEMQITSARNMAFAPGYGNNSGGHFQFGAGSPGSSLYPPWMDFHRTLAAGASTLGRVGGLALEAAYMDGSSVETTVGWPGVSAQATSLTGDYEMDLMLDRGNSGGDDATLAQMTIGGKIYGGGNKGKRGTVLNGAQRRERLVSTYTTANTAIDFAAAKLLDMSAGTVATTFYSTNWTFGTNTTFATTEEAEMELVIRAGGFAATFTWPAWSVLGASAGGTLPSSIAPDQLIFIHLRCLGLGETNIIAQATLAKDQSFSYQQEVQNFMFQSGLTDTATSNALNSVVKSLKADSTWSQLDFYYPFVGTTAAHAKWNLVNTNTFKITWTGAVSVSGGVTGGAGIYGDTGWRVTSGGGTQNNVAIFAYGTAMSASDNDAIFGLEDTTNNRRTSLRRGSATAMQGVVNAVNADASAVTVTYPNGVAISRSASGSFHTLFNYASDTSQTSTSVTPPAFNLYVLARNQDGGPQNNWTTKVQAVAGGQAFTLAQYQTLFTATTNLNAALSR